MTGGRRARRPGNDRRPPISGARGGDAALLTASGLACDPAGRGSVRSGKARPSAYVIPTTVQVIRPPARPDNRRIRVLIITGRSSFEHDWKGTTNELRNMLEDTGRFAVRVTEEFRGATAQTLAAYDVVLLNYCGRWFYDEPVEERWGKQAEATLFSFVRKGKGIVVYHPTFMLGAPDWPEFERLAGAALRQSPTPSRRAPVDAFRIRVIDREHPITRGMREYLWTFMDDMYTNLRWHPQTKDMRVLVTGYDDAAAYAHALAGPKYPPEQYTAKRLAAMPGMNQEHPLVWTSRYGKGRVYSCTLGHGPDTLRYEALISLLVRGTEWAATGSVTVPLNDKAVEF